MPVLLQLIFLAHSIQYLKSHFIDYPNLTTCLADIECLPFKSNSFDVVVSAGVLSYGIHEVVLNEIHRVLAPGGCFICVDSLNHNPLYI